MWYACSPTGDRLVDNLGYNCVIRNSGGGNAVAACPTPNAADPEDGTDTCDEDGDGSLAVRRGFVSGMDPLVTQDFTLVGAAVVAGGRVKIPSAGTVGVLQSRDEVPWTTGEVHVHVAVEDYGTSNQCLLKLTTAAGTCLQPLVDGVNDVACFVPTGLPITNLNIECNGVWPGSYLLVDWLTVANGPYRMAPMNDVSAVAFGMRAPNGGSVGVVRTDHTGTLMFAGSNVGGLAWSDDGATWVTANGQAGDLDNASDMGVFEVVA